MLMCVAYPDGLDGFLGSGKVENIRGVARL